MTDLNKVFVVGRAVRDIGEKDFSYISSDSAVLKTSLAVNRGVKKGDKWEDEASFFDVTIWGKLAESLKNYIKKGTKMLICGHLQQDRWEKDGQKYSKISIVAEEVTLCGGTEKQETSTPSGFKKKDDPAFIAQKAEMSYQEDIPF